jgi:hypothetical protein
MTRRQLDMQISRLNTCIIIIIIIVIIMEVKQPEYDWPLTSLW